MSAEEPVREWFRGPAGNWEREWCDPNGCRMVTKHGFPCAMDVAEWEPWPVCRFHYAALQRWHNLLNAREGFKQLHGRSRGQAPEGRRFAVVSPSPDGEWVYFFRRSDGLIKIGYSFSLRSRWRALESEHGQLTLLGCLAGGVGLEGQLHQAFRDHNAHGEWFRPAPRLLQFIAGMHAAVEESAGGIYADSYAREILPRLLEEAHPQEVPA